MTISVPSSFSIHHSMLGVRCSMFNFFSINLPQLSGVKKLSAYLHLLRTAIKQHRATRQVSATVVTHVRILLPAVIDGMRTTGMKGAAGWFVGRIGNGPGYAVQSFSTFGAMGNGCQKRLGVWMAGILKDRNFGSLLGNRSGIHYADAICGFANNAQIVRNI